MDLLDSDQYHKDTPPSTEEFNKLVDSLDFDLSSEYLDFIRNHNGGDGFIGEDCLNLWDINSILYINSKENQVNPEFTKKFWLFATNTGIFQYAFEKSTGKIFEQDPYEPEYQEFMGNTFKEFIENFSNKTY